MKITNENEAQRAWNEFSHISQMASIAPSLMDKYGDRYEELGDALDEYSGQPGDEVADIALEAMSRVTPRGGLSTDDGRR